MTAKKGIHPIENKYLDFSNKYGAIKVIKYWVNTKTNVLEISRENVIDILENLLQRTFLGLERQIFNVKP